MRKFNFLQLLRWRRGADFSLTRAKRKRDGKRLPVATVSLGAKRNFKLYYPKLTRTGRYTIAFAYVGDGRVRQEGLLSVRTFSDKLKAEEYINLLYGGDDEDKGQE